jgi:hypothetical protein
MRLAYADIEMSDGVGQIDVVEGEQLAGGQLPARGDNQQAKQDGYKPRTASETHDSS